MDPRRLKQWQKVNEVDYTHKLSVTEKQWLHGFNAEYFKKRPRQDVLDQRPEALIEDHAIPPDGPITYQAPQAYLGVTLCDLKLYLRIEKDGVSERQISRETAIPRSTLKYRMRLVERILQNISWSNLFGNLAGEENNDESIETEN
jgi:hypothetical protein